MAFTAVVFGVCGCIDEGEALKLYAVAAEVDTSAQVLADADDAAPDVAQAIETTDIAAIDATADGVDADAPAACSPTDCNDNNACTDDKCVNGIDCTHLANTASCTDGDDCTTGDVCANAACVGKPAYSPAVIVTTPDEQEFRSGVLRADGSVVAAEFLKIKDKSFSRLLSLDSGGPNGAIDVKLDALPKESVYGLVADGGGFALSGSASGSGSDILFVRVSATGAIQLETTIDLGGDEEAYGLTKVGNNYAIFGDQYVPGPWRAFLLLVDNKGKCVSKDCKAIFYTAGEQSEFNLAYGLGILNDGSYWMVGESVTGKDGNSDGVLWHIGADGSDLGYQTFGGPGADSLYGVHLNANGTAVLFGLKNGLGWLIGVDNAGKELWQVVLPATTAVYDIVPAPFGWTVAATTDGGQSILGVDPIGNVLWDRPYLGKPAKLLTTKNGYAIVGDLQGDAQIIFTDPWGFNSCKEASECLGVSSCSDNIACTDDICDSAKGCVHSQAAEGQPCADGSGCVGESVCAAGKCGPGKAIDCDDKNACTADSCNAVKGCGHVVTGDGSPCGDGGACQAGSCKANAVGCVNDDDVCGGGKGKCTNGHCFWTDEKGYKWTLVPAGTFWMGCNLVLDEGCGIDEKPQHLVELSAYWIGVYEVTVAQYKACRDANGDVCSIPGTGANFNWAVPGKEQHPINGVDWSQAQGYCEWIGGDLPTEAQWEKSARGGCELFLGKECKSAEPKYPWGNSAPSCGKQAVFDDLGTGQTCGGPYTTSVGGAGSAQGQSPYGAYDVAGNVWEWNLDWWDNLFYGKTGAAQKDAVNLVGASYHVIRGGGFDASAADVRSGNRSSHDPTNVGISIGMRCARPFL